MGSSSSVDTEQVWIASSKRRGDASERRFWVTWYQWRAGVDVAGPDLDPVSDSFEQGAEFDTLAEARAFAQKQANRLERTKGGPWYWAWVREQRLEHVDDDCWDWNDADAPGEWEAFESRHRPGPKAKP